jgi:hypothetical protein
MASRFISFEESDPGLRSEGVRRWSLEIDADGYIVRELGMDENDRPLRKTNRGDYGLWNDSDIPRLVPGSESYRKFVESVKAREIVGEDFERLFEQQARNPAKAKVSSRNRIRRWLHRG